MYTNRKLATMFSVGLLFMIMGGLALLIHPPPAATANNLQSQFAGGSGTTEDPYLVATAEHLNNVRDQLDAHFRQTAHINLGVAPWHEGEGWTPIGDASNNFTGNFDGNGYIIRNLTINRPSASNQGLFGNTRNASLHNIQLTDVDLRVGYASGALVGVPWTDTFIDNITVTGTIFSERSIIGGVAGNSRARAMHNLSAAVDVQGGTDVGGLVGYVGFGEIRHGRTTGSVQGSGQVGGLVGWNNGGVVMDSYSLASVSGADEVGGLIGRSGSGTGTTYMFRVYSAGAVSGTGDYVGGLLGRVWATTVDAYGYWDTTTSGQSQSARGEGYPTSQMRQQATYQMFNFFGLWTIAEGESYPTFQNLDLYTPLQPVDLTDLSGSGTEADPYIIHNAHELNAIRQDLEAHYRLNNDIDLSSSVIWNYGQGWDPIGSGSHNPPPFSGYLDGNGYAIQNLTINRPNESHQGLFARATQAEIHDLRVENVNIHSGHTSGGLTGQGGSSFPPALIIERVWVTGQILSMHSNIGGMIGVYQYGPPRLYNASAIVQVRGQDNTGGLIGYSLGAEVVSAYSMGTVQGRDRVGGLIGWQNIGSVTNSYSRASVTGEKGVGGLVGRIGGGSGSTTYLYGSYSAGPVWGSGDDVGGFLGELFGFDFYQVELCYWDMEASGQADSPMGDGRATAQMTHPYDGSAYVGWDFLDTWASDTTYVRNEGYPYLQGLTPLPVSITVTAAPAEGGSVTGGGAYDYGRIITVRATPAADWVFVEWRSNGQVISRSANHTFTAVEDQTLTAHFEEAPDPYQTGGLIPTDGGAIFSEIDHTTYQFAPGTFTDTVRLIHTHVPTPPTSAPDRMTDIGYNFVITAVYSDTNQPAQPALPVIVTIGYGEAGYSGAGPFSLWRFDEDTWIQLVSTDDSVQQTLTAEIPHFSQFAVFSETGTHLFLPFIIR